MRVALLIPGLLLVACSTGNTSATLLQSPLKQAAYSEKAIVTQIIDGDTIRVRLPDNNVLEYVRIIGIDTPEADWKTQKMECFAQEAQAKLSELIANQEVTLVPKLDEDRDGFNRLLRYVELGGQDIGAELLIGGYAEDFPWFPHPRVEQYRALEREARKVRTGLWGECR